jgi:hypothetical protein
MSEHVGSESREKDPLSPTTKALLALIQGLLPTMTAIIGGLWIVFTYLDHQQDAQNAAASRAKQEASTRRIEAQRPFLEKQLSLYFETAQVTGRLVTLSPDDEKEWQRIESRFWSLYWSELSLVEDKIVEEAMVKFGARLNDYTSDRKKTNEHNQPFNDAEKKRPLYQAAFELAHAIRASIETGWSGRDQVPPTGQSR